MSGYGDAHVVERVRVFRLRRVEAVRRLVPEHQHHGLPRMILLQPVERQVGDDVV